MCSHKLSRASSISIVLVNRLCKIAKAKIVMHTTHNNTELLKKLISLGLKSENFQNRISKHHKKKFC